MKKLCGEAPKFFFQTQSFKVRFCVLDLSLMTFKYAKSPKEKFTELKMDEIISVTQTDEDRTKPIKTKNQYDLKYLLHLKSEKRTFVFSCNSRCDRDMWQEAFDAFFQIKEAYISYYRHKRTKSVSVLNRKEGESALDHFGRSSNEKPKPELTNSILLHREAINKKSTQEEQKTQSDQNDSDPDDVIFS